MAGQVTPNKKRGWPEPALLTNARQQSKSHHLLVEIVILLVVFVIASLLVEGLIELFQTITIRLGGPEIGNDYSLAILPPGQLASLLASVGTIVCCIVYCRYVEKRKLSTMGLKRSRILRDYCQGLLIGAALISVAIAVCLLTGTLNYQGRPPNSPVFLLVLFFIGFALQSLSEELLFRGYFLVSLARRQTVFVSILISSSFFSLLHITNPGITPLALFNLLLFGAFMAVYFLKQGSIWGVAAIHGTWNFFQGSVWGINVSGLKGIASVFNFAPTDAGSLLNGGSFGLEGGLATTAVLTLALIGTLLVKGRGAQPSS